MMIGSSSVKVKNEWSYYIPHVSSWHALGQLYFLPLVMMTESALTTFLF